MNETVNESVNESAREGSAVHEAPQCARVRTAVHEGRAQDVPGLLTALDDKQRRACLAQLRDLRAGLRNAFGPEDRQRRRALLVAGAGCQSGAAGAAQWLASTDRWFGEPWQPVFEVLADRDPRWLGDVAHRLAERRAVTEDSYDLVAGLALMSGCPVPTTDGFVSGWFEQLGGHHPRPLTERLRADPFTPALLPLLFQAPDINLAPNQVVNWVAALAELTAEGFLDRETVLDACVARLLRGGRPSLLGGFLTLLDAFEPTGQEVAARTGDWVRLACDAPSTAADRAQQMLRRLFEDDRLAPEQLAEASQGVLFRTEKKLVRAQLILLGKALARDPGAAPILLPTVAPAFGHRDADTQERALKLVAKHAAAAGPAARAQLAEAAPRLGTVLRARAAEILGRPSATAQDRPGHQDSVALPPPAPVRRLDPPPSVGELAEHVAVMLNAEWTPVGVAEFERVVDGLVRHAHQDRAGLADALRPILRRLHDRLRFPQGPHALASLVKAVLGMASAEALRAAPAESAAARRCSYDALDAYEGVLLARVWEAALRVVTDPLPCLLATPTDATGQLEPGVLVDRLREYQRLGTPVATADFEQALLRVRPHDAQRWAAAAAGVGSPHGDRLAAWLTAGGLPQAPDGQRLLVDPPPPTAWPAGKPWRRRVLASTHRLPLLEQDFSAPFRVLGAGHTPSTRTSSCPHWIATAAPHWFAVLPGHRETVAAHLVHLLAQGAADDTPAGRQPSGCLTAIAEAPGPAGPATHLALAYGLGARSADERLAAVDALVTLAATGALDADRLGRDVAQLLGSGALRANRVADSLRSAARGGAHATVWAVLAAALPALLADGGCVHGLGEIVGIAAECVEQVGASGAVEHLAETAARRGSSQLLKEARRLHGALAHTTGS